MQIPSYVRHGDEEELFTWLEVSGLSALAVSIRALVARVREEAWPDAASADELHDALVWLGYLTDAEAKATLGWPESRAILSVQALANGRLHTQLLAWLTDGQAGQAELQISLLVNDKNQPQGFLLLAR